MITSEQVLTHYDPSLPLRHACDASPVGIEAVLSHVIHNGTEQPIAFASRTLTKTEQKYAQIDKEALPIIWGVKKFHIFVWQLFHIVQRSSALKVNLLSAEKHPCGHCSSTATLCLVPGGYDYTIGYKNIKVQSNADGLSHLPLVQESRDEEVWGESF